MAAFVLVGGAWIGGWAWQRVALQLRSQGHDAYPVTLTGLGDRVHLARPDVDLDTHIADVVNVLTYEDLQNVILVGHSYAGIVVTGVADRMPERLAQLVYCDSAPFLDGEAYLSVTPPPAREATLADARERGDGWRVPFPGMTGLAVASSLRGLSEANRGLFEAKATSQPLATYTQPLKLGRVGEPAYRRVAIACDNLRALIGLGIPRMVEMTGPGWTCRHLDTGHWPMLSAPRGLADVLTSLVV